MTLPDFGTPFPSDEEANGRHGSPTQKLSTAVSALLNCNQPSSGLQKSSGSVEQNRSTCRTPPHGSTAGAGNPSLMRRPSFDQHLPADRARLNSQDPQWRNGFGSVMVAVSAAYNRAFTTEDITLWAAALAEHALEDIQSGVADWIKNSDNGFPTPGKAIVFVKARRHRRLGIVVR